MSQNGARTRTRAETGMAGNVNRAAGNNFPPGFLPLISWEDRTEIAEGETFN